MAVVDKETIMNRINELLKDDVSDNALSLIEDLNDTLSVGNADSLTNEINSLKSQLTEIENTWRTRYKERFFNSNMNENFLKNEEPTTEVKASESTNDNITIDDLFVDGV